jgi:hypothetical protein
LEAIGRSGGEYDNVWRGWIELEGWERWERWSEERKG